MKHLFLLFLAVNIGLFIWGYQREQVSAHKKPYANANVGELRLLTEQKVELESDLQQEAAPLQELAQIPEEIVQEVMESKQAPVSALDAVVFEPAEKDLERQSEEDEYDDSLPTPQTENETGQQVTQQYAPVETTQEIDASVSETAHQTTELSNQEDGEQVALDQLNETEGNIQIEAVVKPVLLMQPKPICYKLGPIVDLVTVEGLSGHLTQLGLDTVIQKQSIKKTRGYWVMYPPLESYPLAKQKLQELKEAGISDLWLFPKGEHKNAISLGLYSQLSNAEAAYKAALKKGLATEILARHVEIDQYWVEMYSLEWPSIADESRLALQEAYPNEKFEFKPCSTVVTE